MRDVIGFALLALAILWIAERRWRRQFQPGGPSMPGPGPRGFERVALVPFLAHFSAGLTRRLQPSPRGVAAYLAVAFIACWVGQRWLSAPDLDAGALILYGAGLAAIVALDPLVARRAGETAWPSRWQTRSAEAPAWPHRRGLLLASVLATAYVWAQLQVRGEGDRYFDVVGAWGIALVSLGFAAAGPPRLPPVARWRLGQWLPESLLVGAILLFAALIRGIGLDQVPYAFGGDEGSQALSSRAFLTGQSTNPFGTGWFRWPSLYFFLQAAWMSVFGDDVVGARSFSAMLGTVTVLFTYLLGRRFFGRSTAGLAAILLAAFHFHVHFSRISENNIADPLWLVATLFFLDRGLTEGRRLDYVLAGVTAGLGQYFYASGRLILPLAAAYAAFHIYASRRSQAAGGAAPLLPGPALRLLGWMATAAFITYLPLGTYYSIHPGDLSERINAVSALGGWLEREQVLTGMEPLDLIERQLSKGLWLPFHTRPSAIHFYGMDAPFLGMPLAVLTAIGLALATLRCRDARYAGLLAPWWLALLGVGLTEDPTQVQRIVLIAPLVPLLCAVALADLGRILGSLVTRHQKLVVALGGLVALAAVAWNLNYEFRVVGRGPNQYGAGNTIVATKLAYYLRSLDEPVTVYLLGAPRIRYYGFQTLPFIARQARGVDVEEPLGPASAQLAVRGLTIFAALPERAGELRWVAAWYPGGSVVELPGDSGAPLVTVYEVTPA